MCTIFRQVNDNLLSPVPQVKGITSVFHFQPRHHHELREPVVGFHADGVIVFTTSDLILLDEDVILDAHLPTEGQSHIPPVFVNHRRIVLS